MSKLEIGQPLPDFELPATGGSNISAADLRGKRLILFFYPKANTPGCTKEGQGFADRYPDFAARNVEILGVSRDGVKAQENFKEKYAFPFELLSDKDEVLCQAFDVLKEKNMYGKISIGIERSTFLFDEAGILRKEWRKVKVDGHVEEVWAALDELP